jgi:hypothetical protein
MSIMDCLHDKKKVLKLGLVMRNELIKQVQMSLKMLILLDGNTIINSTT